MILTTKNQGLDNFEKFALESKILAHSLKRPGGGNPPPTAPHSTPVVLSFLRKSSRGGGGAGGVLWHRLVIAVLCGVWVRSTWAWACPPSCAVPLGPEEGVDVVACAMVCVLLCTAEAVAALGWAHAVHRWFLYEALDSHPLVLRRMTHRRSSPERPSPAPRAPLGLWPGHTSSRYRASSCSCWILFMSVSWAHRKGVTARGLPSARTLGPFPTRQEASRGGPLDPEAPGRPKPTPRTGCRVCDGTRTPSTWGIGGEGGFACCAGTGTAARDGAWTQTAQARRALRRVRDGTAADSERKTWGGGGCHKGWGAGGHFGRCPHERGWSGAWPGVALQVTFAVALKL